MVPIHTLDSVELFFNSCSILINSTVIHRYGVAGGVRRGGGSSTYDIDPSPYPIDQLNLTILHTIWG